MISGKHHVAHGLQLGCSSAKSLTGPLKEAPDLPGPSQRGADGLQAQRHRRRQLLGATAPAALTSAAYKRQRAVIYTKISIFLRKKKHSKLLTGLQHTPTLMPSHLVTKKMLSVSQEIKILGGECLAALLSHTNLPSRKRTLSADGSVSLQHASEAKQFPSFLTGHQLPLQAPKDLRFLGTTTCPACPPSSGSPCAALTPAGTPRGPSSAPRGVRTPHRPDSAAGPGPEAGPLRPDPAGGRTAAAALSGSARPGQGTASPRPGTTDTHVPHTRNTHLAPARYHRPGANSHPGGSRIPLPGHSRVTATRHIDADKQGKDGEREQPASITLAIASPPSPDAPSPLLRDGEEPAAWREPAGGAGGQPGAPLCASSKNLPFSSAPLLLRRGRRPGPICRDQNAASTPHRTAPRPARPLAAAPDPPPSQRRPGGGGIGPGPSPAPAPAPAPPPQRPQRAARARRPRPAPAPLSRCRAGRPLAVAWGNFSSRVPPPRPLLGHSAQP